MGRLIVQICFSHPQRLFLESNKNTKHVWFAVCFFCLCSVVHLSGLGIARWRPNVTCQWVLLIWDMSTLLLLQGKPSDVENRFGKIGGLFGVTPIVSRLRDLCTEITNRCFDGRQELIAAVLPMIAAQFWWCQLQLSIDFMIPWHKHSLVYFCFKRFTWQLIWAWFWPVWPTISQDIGCLETLVFTAMACRAAQRPGITWRAAAHWVRWLAITSRSGCTRVWMTPGDCTPRGWWHLFYVK